MNQEDLGALDPSTFGEQPTEPQQVEEINKADHSMSADDQRDFIQKALHRFRIAADGMGDHHKRWALIDQFDRGRQWDNVNIPVWIPKPITNLIRYVRTTKRANLAQA